MPHPPLRSRALSLALPALAAALLAPAAAQASNVTTPDFPPALNVHAAPGEDNRMIIKCDFSFGGPSTCVVEDFEGITESSDICTPNSSTKVTCTGDPFTGAPVVDLGDLDDFLEVTSNNVQGFTVTGGAGDDTIYGGNGGLGDTIDAGPGNDWVEGRHGGDTIHGGSGRDTVIGQAGYNLVYGDAGNDTLMSGPGLGTQSALYGGYGNDHLIGGNHADKLIGQWGEDLLDGGKGNDDLDGGVDTDTVDYADRTAPVTVDLDDTQYDDGNADDASGYNDDRDRVRTSVERVLGGAGGDRLTASGALPVTFLGNGGADHLVGSNAVDVLAGGSSNDILDGLLGGDTLNGGDGADAVDYASRTGRIAVRLDNARNDGADTNGDKVSAADEEGDLTLNVENASTGSGDDYLSGNALVNRLSGAGGADRIQALDGTTGVDVVSCGNGVDVYAADPSDSLSFCNTAGTP